MAKTAAYGISEVTIANPGVNGAYPSAWNGTGAFSFKAIVKDSFSFNDSEASYNDIEVEDSDDIYASLQSSLATKGFTMDTYDLSAEAYAALMQFTTDANGWNVAPTRANDLIKAVQVITKALDEFPSKTFQWAKMLIQVTRAGTLGRSGFPNFHITFKEQMNTNAAGEPISGHRWKMTTPVEYEAVDSSATGYSSKNPAQEGWYERTGTSPNYEYRLTWDTAVVDGKTYYEVSASE